MKVSFTRKITRKHGLFYEFPVRNIATRSLNNMLLILRVTVGWYGILRVLLRVLFSEKSNMRVCAQTVTWRYTSHSRQQCCSARIKHCQRCFKNSYLVDPASSHMLVSKIKPCMSKYKRLVLWNCEWLIKSVMVYLMVPYYLDNRSNSRANTCRKSRLWRDVFIR